MRRCGLLAVAALLAACAAPADPPSLGLVVEDAWSRPAPSGGVGVVYMRLKNEGTTADRLLTARSPACESVELHRTSRDGDRVTMAPVVEGVELGPGDTLVLEPGGHHLMLFGLRQALAPGDRLDVVLELERRGELTVSSVVR